MECQFGFKFKRGKRVSYRITAPTLSGSIGLTVSGVSHSDRKRIMREMAVRRDCNIKELLVERIEE